MTARFSKPRRGVALALALVLGAVLLPGPAASHDIPDQIILRAFV
jgi:hypothetical protein